MTPCQTSGISSLMLTNSSKITLNKYIQRLVPTDKILKNPKMILLETQKGGHIDFFTSRKLRRWYSYIIN